jgi:hypothetical protein
MSSLALLKLCIKVTDFDSEGMGEGEGKVLGYFYFWIQYCTATLFVCTYLDKHVYGPQSIFLSTMFITRAPANK